LKQPLNIVGYCHIKNHTISVNGQSVISKDSELSFADFSKQIYKEKPLTYPKFFKMDNLCKLAFLASEFLIEHTETNTFTKENMGVVLSNTSASLDTDRKYQGTIIDKENFFPSPAVFVYTLANIAIGEISIRHQIKGENAFFVSENFNETLLEQYATSLIFNKKSSCVLCGWVDFDGDNYHAFMYLVAKEGAFPHSKEFIKNIYNEN